MTNLIEDYDELTVDEVRSALEEAELSASGLRTVLGYEQATKDRVTLTRWIERQLDDDVEESEAEPDEEPETVVVTSYKGGYVAGVWFDRPLVHKEVDRTTRIDRAIEDGRLVEVGTDD